MRIATGLLAVCLWFCVSQDVEARASRVGQLPNGAVFGCANCHVSASGGGQRTSFGNAVPLSGSGPGATVVWNATVAAADADGDGFSNGTELGDPDGDGVVTPGVTVTNPGDATSFPQVVNRAPVLAAIDPQAVLEGETISFTLDGSDEDGDTLTYTATNLPEGATFEEKTFSWVPGFDLGGSTVMVTFTATDGSEDASITVDIAISDVNRPAAFLSTTPSRDLVVAMEGDGVNFSVEAEDPDGDAVTYAWSVNGASDAETSGTFVLTVPSGAQDEMVSVTATSADGTQATQTWTIAKMLVADFDGDGEVGFVDFLSFTAVFGKTSADAEFDAKFDLDGDNAIGFGDFLRFVSFFGLTTN